MIDAESAKAIHSLAIDLELVSHGLESIRLSNPRVVLYIAEALDSIGKAAWQLREAESDLMKYQEDE